MAEEPAASANAAAEEPPRFANATAAFAALVHCRAAGAGTAEVRAMIADERVVAATRAFLAAQCGGAAPPYPNAVRAVLSAYAGPAAEQVQEQLASGDSTRRASGSAGLRVARAGLALLGEAQRLCDEEAAAAARAESGRAESGRALRPAARAAAKAAAKAGMEARRAKAAALAAARAKLAAAERAFAERAAAAPVLAAAAQALAAEQHAAPRVAGFRALLDAYMAAMAAGRAADIAALERRGRLVDALRNLLAQMERADDPTNVQQVCERMVLQRKVAGHGAIQAEWARTLGIDPPAAAQ